VLLTSQLSKVKNALLGLLLAPLYTFEERERDRKLRERLARLEKRNKWHQRNNGQEA
jgi:hypothetical protein